MEFRVASGGRNHGESGFRVVAVILKDPRRSAGGYFQFIGALRHDGLEQFGGENVGRGDSGDVWIGRRYIGRREIRRECSHGEKHWERVSQITKLHGYLFLS